MTDTAIEVDLPQLPFARPDALHTSPRFRELREQGPVVRVLTQTGDRAWLVVGYEEARAAFADRRLGYFVHQEPEKAARASDSEVHGAPIGGDAFDRDMARLRKLLAPALTPKRLRLLVGWM